MKYIKYFFYFCVFIICVFIIWRLIIPIDFKKSPQTIQVSKGQNFTNLAKDLQKRGLIRSKWDLHILVKFFGNPVLFQGEYDLDPSQSLWTLFQTLKQGRDKDFLVSFPDGLNHYEMFQILKSHDFYESDQFLKNIKNNKLIKQLVKQDLDSFEGYLFPDTYKIKKHTTAIELLTMMTQNFHKVYQQFENLLIQNNLSKHQIVSLASIVEKETALESERALIAGVFFNRLNRNMRLQTDPTVLYASYLVKGFDIKKNITKRDLRRDSVYNTYKIFGLPFGPIANPGEKSLQASFFPQKSDKLYFVSKNDGSHYFSATYKEHAKAVHIYQVLPFR